MSFYRDFVLILVIFEKIWVKSGLNMDKVRKNTLSRFYPDFLETHFIQILS